MRDGRRKVFLENLVEVFYGRRKFGLKINSKDVLKKYHLIGQLRVETWDLLLKDATLKAYIDEIETSAK
jgi:hypothetical protein